jgi:hypothetical protein
MTTTSSDAAVSATRANAADVSSSLVIAGEAGNAHGLRRLRERQTYRKQT